MQLNIGDLIAAGAFDYSLCEVLCVCCAVVGY